MKVFSVEFGYEVRSIELTDSDWESIQNGVNFFGEVEDAYEGGTITYYWEFNPEGSKGNIVSVTYDDGGTGFVGPIGDGWITES